MTTLSLFISGLSLTAFYAFQPDTPRFTSRLLSHIPPSAKVKADTNGLPIFFFSSEGDQVFYAVKSGGKEFTVINDRPGPVFDAVANLTLSPDGRSIAYTGTRKGRQSVLVGDKQGEEFDRAEHIVFSPDGKRIAYAAKQGGQHFIVVDGVKGDAYEDVRVPAFSPDGTQIAFGARSSGRWYIVANGKKSEDYDNVGNPLFSPDGKTVVYKARLGNALGASWFVFHDEPGRKYNDVKAPVFSRDGSHLAYVAIDLGPPKTEFVVLNGKIESIWGAVYNRAPVFSSDGARVAYRARTVKGGFWFGKDLVVVGAQSGEEFDMVGDPTFSHDGKRVAYLAENGKAGFLIIGDLQDDKYSFVSKQISAAGGKPAFPIFYIDVSGALSPYSPVFSLDGKVVVYVAWNRATKGHFVVAGDKMGEEYDWVTRPAFSADGKQVGYGVRKGAELWWKVLNVE